MLRVGHFGSSLVRARHIAFIAEDLDAESPSSKFTSKGKGTLVSWICESHP